ncbi:MAG: hypothetical protein JW803_00915 [Endomicrobiales bacterium]|nr:hypothetical protein [Endomicrobiales bacterium]
MAVCAAQAWARFPDSEEIERMKERLPELKIKEMVVNVSPKTQVYLPSGALDLGLKQEFRKTSLEFNSRYDFVDSFMGFNLELLYKLTPAAVGFDLYDKVDFNEVYSNVEYIQRSQAVAPFAQRYISKTTKIRGSLAFENTYTSSLSTSFKLDQGRNVLGQVGMYNNTVEETTSTPKGGMRSIVLMKSFEVFGSDYDYMQSELYLQQYFGSFSDHYLGYEFRAGYPIDAAKRPFTSFYYVGGYRILRGYDFKEFMGDALLYQNLSYNIPLAKSKIDPSKSLAFSILTWNFFSESAKIGDKKIYELPEDVKANFGTGVAYRIMLFRIFPVQLEFSVAKAMEPRDPEYYVTLSTIYYTWQN